MTALAPGLIVVDIADLQTAHDPQAILATYSLGSCLGVSLFDPATGVGGMGHFMLPLSNIDAAKAKAKPAMFVDTGVTALLSAVFELGAKKQSLIVKIAGCGSILDESGLFKIGERNHTVLRKLLWKNSILIAAEDIGGTAARTMHLHLSDGRTTIRSSGTEKTL